MMQMPQLHHVYRSLGTGLFVFLTGMLALGGGVPDSWNAVYQPALTGLLAFLGSLGFSAVVKSPEAA